MLTVPTLLTHLPVLVKLDMMVMVSINVMLFPSKTNVPLATIHVIQSVVFALILITVIIAHVTLVSGMKTQTIPVVNAMVVARLSILSSRVAAKFGPVVHSIQMQSHKVATNGSTNVLMASNSNILTGMAGRTGSFLHGRPKDQSVGRIEQLKWDLMQMLKEDVSHHRSPSKLTLMQFVRQESMTI